MTYRVIVLPSAELDITNAAAWIADHSPAAAASWVEGIREAIHPLGIMPSRCPMAQGLFGGEMVVRQLLYGRRRQRYRILFTVRGDTVQVLRVRHSARARIRR